MNKMLTAVYICLLSGLSYAGDPININNQNNGSNNSSGGCTDNADLYKNNRKSGVYTTQNGQETNETYTTGDKTPYYVDNRCGNSNNGAVPIVNYPNNNKTPQH